MAPVLKCHKSAIFREIKQGWTPEQIGNCMIYESDKKRVCQETIYRYTYFKEGMAQELWWYLPLYRKNRAPHCACKRHPSKFDRDVSILFQPDNLAHRRQFDHIGGCGNSQTTRYEINLRLP